MLFACAAVLATVWVVAFPRVVPPLTAVWGYASAMLLPGAGLCLWVKRRVEWTEVAMMAFLLSPVLSALVSVLVMLVGVGPEQAGRLAATLGVLLFAGGCLRSSNVASDLSRSEAIRLGLLVVAICALPGVMTYTEEWWRIRSDGWFHRAVIAEIDAYHLPPGDPYFAGMELQYMWVYHVLHLVLAKVSGLRPQWTMALFNTQALAGLMLAAFGFASIFKSRFGHRIGSAVTVPLGMTALFWAYLPYRIARAFTGEVRGWEEVQRQLSLQPFSYQKAYAYMNVYHNPEFFIEKFVVATAFSLALALTVLAWMSATRYLKDGNPWDAVVTFAAVLGMMGFHLLVGLFMLAAIVTGVGFLWLLRNRSESVSVRRLMVLVGSSFAAVVVSAPYVYWVTRLKSSSGEFPLVFSPNRIIGVGIAVTLVALWSWFQRDFWTSKEAPARFVTFGFLGATAAALTLALPGSNEFDKPGYFVFIPLALVGGWSLLDLGTRWGGKSRAVPVALILAFLAFAPVNLLGCLGWYFTPIPTEVSTEEQEVAEWVRTNTDRDAVFIDRDAKIFLLTEGPRRYFYGRHSYAVQWGYDASIMGPRWDAVRALYDTEEPLTSDVLRTLAVFEDPLYVIIRSAEGEGDGKREVEGNGEREGGAEGERGGGGEAGANTKLTNVQRHADLFEVVHRSGELAVARVDKDACLRAAEEPKK